MNPASPRQISFINSLVEERGYDLGDRNPAGFTVREASEMIEFLLALPKPAPRVAFRDAVAELSEGMYRLANGDIYRVQRGRESGKLYAKKLDWANNRFEFVAGALFRLTADDRMTLADAKEWGVATGVCCVCGAFLTDAKSVEAGIGPVCAKRV